MFHNKFFSLSEHTKFYRVLFSYTLRNFTILSIYKSYMNTSFKTLILFSFSLSFSLLLSLSLKSVTLWRIVQPENSKCFLLDSSERWTLLTLDVFFQIRVISVLMNSFAGQMVYSTHPHLRNFEALVDPRISLTLLRKRPFSRVLVMDFFFRTNNSISLPLFYISNALGSRSFSKNRVIPLRVFLCILKRHVIYTLE